MEGKKCVIVGDDSTNKTQLIYNYVNNNCTNEYCPTFVDNFSKIIKKENETVKLQIYETTCQSEYKALRISTYYHTNVFILCFDLNDIKTLNNAKNFWYPEIRNTCPKAKIVLTGIITNENDKLISHDLIKEARESIKAVDYVECNLYKMNEVYSVFKKAFKAIFLKKKKKISSFFKKSKKEKIIEVSN